MSPATFIVVHSATALNSEKTKESLTKDFAVNLFVDHDCEPKMLEHLQIVASKFKSI